jgi:hypothetical protein
MAPEVVRCPRCAGPLSEIERFGERLVGCTECNRWTWPNSAGCVFLSLPQDDLITVRRRVTPIAASYSEEAVRQRPFSSTQGVARGVTFRKHFTENQAALGSSSKRFNSRSVRHDFYAALVGYQNRCERLGGCNDRVGRQHCGMLTIGNQVWIRLAFQYSYDAPAFLS